MIRVFNSDDKLYDTNGNVVIKPTYANVHKEDNGAYYLDIETNLQNEVIKHIEAQAGTNIEINSSATLTDVDATKEAKLTALKGATTQSGTPTPSTPQPINVVTGDQDINVCGKNLFDGEVELGSINTSGNTTTNNALRSTNYIKVKPSTQYTISNDLNYTTRIYEYNSSKTYIANSSQASTTYTFTTSATTEYIRFRTIESSTQNNLNVKVMLEKGNQATTYEAFTGNTYEINLGDVELCKIGTYQDKIYKDNGIWYLHKEIGKKVITGSDSTLARGGTNSSNEYRWRTTLDNPLPATSISTIVPSFSNRLTSVTAGNTYNKIEGIAIDTANDYAFFYITDTKSYTLDNMKTWLNTNNLTLYYILNEATNTPIEDTDLIEQLNSIELLNGLNNISVTSSDLPALLNLHYNYVTGGDVTTGDYLQPNNILVANTPTGNQAFRITSIEKTRHKIKIKANHVFYDSMNYVIQDSYVVDKNLNDALDHLNNATDNTSPFTTLSNVTTINSFRCVRKSLYEAVNVLLERWGGHLVRDNFNLKIMDAIGQDNGVTVRYGKNLKDITVDYNWDNVVTKILPVGYDGLLLDEIYIYADIQYDVPYTKVVHFEQDLDINDYKDEDGNVDEDAYINALKADLRSQAHNYLQQNSIPKVNYELQANLEKITDVGDIIEVIDERLGVNIMTSLISYDYDCILEKYTTLEFGNFQKKLNDLTSYIETQSAEVATEISNETKVTLQTELAQATSQLWGVLGNSYVIYEGDKILVVDSLPKESATNVLMINSGGIGFSNTGINGTFSSAWTIDGTLNMENINVINLTADLIKGGTLKLGSNINQNGILEVYDEANNLIAQLTKDGLRMNATDGGYLLINTTVGFSGYDRNDNRIYWVDGDEFHMKKSVVEEEITLVDKMRIIPITITENDVIVNDGIGFVSTL